MTRSLNRLQATLLGLVVVLCLAIGVGGLYSIGGKSGMFSDSFELVLLSPNAQDVGVGTPVSIRGVEAGQVVGVEPTDDGVEIRVQINGKYRERLFADTTAAIQSKGILGASTVEIRPGSSNAGRLTASTIVAKPAPDLAEITEKLAALAGRVDAVVKELQDGNGTLPKLLRDDTVYNDLKETSADTKKLVKNLDEAVTGLRGDAQKTLTKVDSGVEAVHTELGELKGLVRTGKEAANAIRQDAEAVKSLPILRGYVEDHVGTLVRPDCEKDRVVYGTDYLFVPGTTSLTDGGRYHLEECAAWLNGQKLKGSEVVVASFFDSNSKEQSPESARMITKKQAETVVEFFRDRGVHKMGYVTRRKVTGVGLGQDPSPVVEKDPLFATRVEIILFAPR